MISTFLDPGEPCLVHPARHFLRLAALQALNRLSVPIIPPCAVFHASNLVRTLPRRARISATLHDLTAWIVPEHHTGIQIAADKRFADQVLRRADAVIAVSESSRNDAIRILRLQPDRVRVIYPGVASPYFSAAPAVFEKPYFLFVGSIEPRKNLDTLLDAWISLPFSFRAAHELRIVGMPAWNSERTLRRLAQLERDGFGVCYSGYVAESRMPDLTAGAHALICPSHYEGFGFPVAQAMAAGCPVIASNNSSLAEITAGAALLTDPRSAGEIASAIRRTADDPGLRETLRRQGKQRAERFRWESSARQSLQFLLETASSV